MHCFQCIAITFVDFLEMVKILTDIKLQNTYSSEGENLNRGNYHWTVSVFDPYTGPMGYDLLIETVYCVRGKDFDKRPSGSYLFALFLALIFTYCYYYHACEILKLFR